MAVSRHDDPVRGACARRTDTVTVDPGSDESDDS
jgi:hypothetical protein